MPSSFTPWPHTTPISSSFLKLFILNLLLVYRKKCLENRRKTFCILHWDGILRSRYFEPTTCLSEKTWGNGTTFLVSDEEHRLFVFTNLQHKNTIKVLGSCCRNLSIAPYLVWKILPKLSNDIRRYLTEANAIFRIFENWWHHQLLWQPENLAFSILSF